MALNDFVKSQVAAGLARDDVVGSVYEEWKQKLGNMAACDAAGKTQLTQALKSAPWSEEQETSLARIILDGNPNRAANDRKKNQRCHNFENMVPEATLCKIRNPEKWSRTSRASFLAAAANNVGLVNPDQPTLFRMVGLLAYGEKIQFTQENVNGWTCAKA